MTDGMTDGMTDAITDAMTDGMTDAIAKTRDCFTTFAMTDGIVNN
ncbi:hypothetical protein [Kamptonema sp. UHCC 0994]|nr:hypothetical protein [Kamptonema sp. UHCC 0994]MDF0553050.1 hypothetical protein [Kamptonema sp. UHCC 0994]